MTPFVISAALLMAAQAPAQPATPPAELARLTPASHAALRCSAAFALVSYGREHDSQTALKWPDVDARGREYFVRVMARLMDETGLDRAAVSRLASYQAQKLLDGNEIDAAMPGCLALLDQSGI